MTRPSISVGATVALIATTLGCAGNTAERKPEDWRAQLRASMQQDVATRERRDELSQQMSQAVEGAELERLTQPQLRAALGEGLMCGDDALCKAQGFSSEDWYYPIGHASDPKIKQLPVLIIGWDPQGRVARVYSLRTH